jgi:[ribosomal protein S5]-alanine N-acetyltransferase
MAGMPLITPELHRSRLHLRPFTNADAEALFALHSNAHVLRYWDAPQWTERDDHAARFLAVCEQMAKADQASVAVAELDVRPEGER